MAENRQGGHWELGIGAWEVDPAHNEIRRNGETVRMEPKAVEVLVHLARHAGHVVAREELLSAVWPGVVVGDDALTQAIIKLRKALGDDAHQPTYIETISKRGYRLIAHVTGATMLGTRPTARRGLTRRGAVALVALAGAALLALFAIVQSGVLVKMPWPMAADTHGSAAAAVPTVAVLPLGNLSGDPRREYFSDGVTEDVIGALGRFSGVRVMSRNAVQPYKGNAAARQAIREQLGVRYIVQGSVREADGSVRVAIELSDAATGTLLWAERYDGAGTQIFEIQDRIARNIAGKLHVKLTQAEARRTSARPTESLEAYDLVLRARALLNRAERRGNIEARALLARATQLAPQFPEVLVAQGEAELQRALYGWIDSPGDATRRAQELARRALAFPEQRAHTRAHTLLGSIHTALGEVEPALYHSERAIELNPSEAAALYQRGGALLYIGRVEEALATLETARQFEPYPDALAGYNLALAYYVAGRYREALTQAEAMLARAPRHIYLGCARAAALSQLGQTAEAAQAAGQVRRFSPDLDVDNVGKSLRNPEHRARYQDGLRKAGL